MDNTMAHTITPNTAPSVQRGPISKALQSVCAALIQLSESNVRVRKVNELWSLSDDELARRGLERHNIVHRVMVGKEL